MFTACWLADSFPAFCQVNTSGYDIRNDADDIYLFVVRGDYTALKTAYVALTGPVPLLPDWAFGTWFTEWHNYSQAVAEAEQRRWRTDRLPLSVWGLDINVRALTSGACHARTGCCCRMPLPDDLFLLVDGRCKSNLLRVPSSSLYDHVPRSTTGSAVGSLFLPAGLSRSLSLRACVWGTTIPVLASQVAEQWIWRQQLHSVRVLLQRDQHHTAPQHHEPLRARTQARPEGLLQRPPTRLCPGDQPVRNQVPLRRSDLNPQERVGLLVVCAQASRSL